MPTELEVIALRAEFDLYLSFVKRLVLDLPDCTDRTRAALWLQKLRSIIKPDQLKLRNEHLKLFLFALHRRALIGLFEHKPPKDELDSFHDGLTLLEMTRELIELAERRRTEGKQKGEPGYGVCPLPQVRTNISYDMKEYSACQEIPKFGAHVYYAVSSEPVQMWEKSPGEYPENTLAPNQLQWETTMAKLTDHVLEREAAYNAEMDAQKQAESGFVFEDKPEEVKKDETLDVVLCSGATVNFRWKADSKLLLHQTYDFSDIGEPDNLIEQGKCQLELDEKALSVLDESLPGRRKVHIRVPYYKGLPVDFIDRRHHSVYEEIPESSCEGPPCEESGEEEAQSGDDCLAQEDEGKEAVADKCNCGNCTVPETLISKDYGSCTCSGMSQLQSLPQLQSYDSHQCSNMQQTSNWNQPPTLVKHSYCSSSSSGQLRLNSQVDCDDTIRSCHVGWADSVKSSYTLENNEDQCRQLSSEMTACNHNMVGGQSELCVCCNVRHT